MTAAGPAPAVEETEDVCALPLVRRVAATLDLDPARWRTGDALPRGWHVALFTVPTRQSELRPDGVGGLGVTLPDLGLPRLMAGGRRTDYAGDIRIGDALRRRSRITAITPKAGRSGRFVLVTLRHEIAAAADPAPVVIEEQDYVMREAAGGASPASPVSGPSAGPSPARFVRTVAADEALLLRYCAITFNTHRIHYDAPYARDVEGYRALVVNGGLPLLLLLQMFREEAGREPVAVTTRNIGPLFCGEPIRLCAEPGPSAWHAWAEDPRGRPALEATIR